MLNFLNGFVAYIKAALAKVWTLVGGLAALFSWVKLPTLPSLPTLPTLLPTLPTLPPLPPCSPPLRP